MIKLVAEGVEIKTLDFQSRVLLNKKHIIGTNIGQIRQILTFMFSQILSSWRVVNCQSFAYSDNLDVPFTVAVYKYSLRLGVI